MLFLHLFHRTNSSAKVSELREFLLDCLQPLVPLAVIDLSLYFISVLTPVSIVQLSNLRDLGAETPNFFAKHCEMIHTTSIAFRPIECRSPIRPSENKRFYVHDGSSQEQAASALPVTHKWPALRRNE